jgi:hypothetical protein
MCTQALVTDHARTREAPGVMNQTMDKHAAHLLRQANKGQVTSYSPLDILALGAEARA